jgi:photosystem II stability/assembly factor-like uncharacterized protein
VATKLAACLALTSFPLWAAWEAIGPFGGSAAVVQVDRQQKGVVLAATSHAQLFRSDDSGASWRSLSFPAERRATLHAFVVDPHAAGVFLVGLSSNTLEYSGIFRTQDGGLTWDRIASPGLQEVWSIAIWDRDSRVIAAGTVEGVFLTQDGGQNWEHLGSPDDPEPKPVVSLAFDPLDSSTLYAGTPHLPWKTMDGGATWHSVHAGMLDDSDVFSILLDSRRRQTLFAGACGGIYRSLDSGVTWTKLRQATGASERTYQIVQHPLKPNVLLAATALGLIRSVDGGTTWRRLSTHSTKSIAFDSAQPNRIFLATDDAGLFRSDDLGETIQRADRGFSNLRFNSLAASGNTLYVGLHGFNGPSILRRNEAEDGWEVMPPGHAAEGNPFNVADADDLGASPDSKRAAVRPASIESRLASLVLAAGDGSKLLVDVDDGVYRTDDGGLTWNLVDSHSRSPDDSRIYSVVATGDGALLAATSKGLMRSDNRGMTWRHLQGVLGGNTVKAICRHPTKAGVLFASLFGTILASTDHGRSWKPLSEGPGGDTVSALLVVPGSPDRLFALTESRGVYTVPLDEP